MRWTWKIARFADIDVYVHSTFFLLLAWVGLSYWQQTGSISAVIGGISFILLLFVCVVLHEFGHALTARRYGISTRHITLLPIGGVALLEGMPDNPKQEIMVALAGPAVNLLIALALWLWLMLGNSVLQLDMNTVFAGSFIHKLLAINVMLAIFNLLPAFPMDGGRVLRATISIFKGPAKATLIAARVGQALALGLAIIGFRYDPFLIFIAVFIWMSAASEQRMQAAKIKQQQAIDEALRHHKNQTPDGPDWKA